MSDDVLSIGEWSDNAALIRDVIRIGYIDGDVLDMTYGQGKFWTGTGIEPVRNDLHPNKGDHTHDVRCPPPECWLQRFDTVIYDPPYAMSGRRDAVPGAGQGTFSEDFGLLDGPKDRDIPELIARGVLFGLGCLNKKGHLLVKCQDQQWSGKYLEQTDIVRRTAAVMRYRVVAKFHMRTRVRAQPGAQKTPRNNYSTLMVLGRKAPL